MRYASKLSQANPGQMLRELVHPSVLALIELKPTCFSGETLDTDELQSSTYRGNKGHILLRNDGVRVLIEAFYGEKVILRSALRDRMLDSTDGRSPLTFFPNSDPACNRLPAPDFLAAELSIYSWDPNAYLDGLDVEETVGHFIADPDFYIWKTNFNPELFFTLWEQAFFLGRAPWQTATPMKGVATYFVKQAGVFLKGLGYHRVDAVPSWFNVARFFKKLGYTFTYGEHRLAYEGLEKALKNFPGLTAGQQSWLVALQNVPEAYLPDRLNLNVRWPVTHTNMYWARMHLDLNAYQAQAKPANKLSERIANMRVCSAPEQPQPVLHTAANCPCMRSVGASSPVVTGPAATDYTSEQHTSV